MTFFSRFCLFMLVAVIGCNVSACGQKGPLVIPVKPPAISTPYPISSTSPTSSTQPQTD